MNTNDRNKMGGAAVKWPNKIGHWRARLLELNHGYAITPLSTGEQGTEATVERDGMKVGIVEIPDGPDSTILSIVAAPLKKHIMLIECVVLDMERLGARRGDIALD